MISNILLALATLLLTLISSFAMYLPLQALVKNKQISLRYAIPFSISIEILIGYIFYCLNIVKFFPLAYLGLAILANAWALFKLWPLNLKKPRLNLQMVAIILVLSSTVFYTRYHDAFKFISPNGPDTYSHIAFIKDLLGQGFLRNGYYAPGLHLFMMPIAKIIPPFILYRFAGPAIGIIILVSFMLLVKDYLKNKVLLVSLIALLTFPAYNQFSLQTIYFFSSALTFIFFASFISLFPDQNLEHSRISLSLAFVISLALALTVPYFFIILISASLAALIVICILKKKIRKNYPPYILKIIAILFLGFIVSFGHVYIQSNLLKRYWGFPGIVILSGSGAAEGLKDIPPDLVTANDELADKFRLPSLIASNPFLKPMVGTGYDILRIKFIRPFNNALGIGAYLWIAFSILLLFGAICTIRKRNSSLLIALATFSLVFGLSVQTGLLEISSYRGRSGWYLMMLSILCLVILADRLYSKKMFRYFLALSLILSATGFIFPPKFRRYDYEEEFKYVLQIAKENPGSTIPLISSNRQIDIVAGNLLSLPWKPESLKSNNAFLILDKEEKLSPIRKEKIAKENQEMRADENFKKFRVKFENENFTVFEKIHD